MHASIDHVPHSAEGVQESLDMRESEQGLSEKYLYYTVYFSVKKSWERSILAAKLSTHKPEDDALVSSSKRKDSLTLVGGRKWHVFALFASI